MFTLLTLRIYLCNKCKRFMCAFWGDEDNFFVENSYDRRHASVREIHSNQLFTVGLDKCES